MKLGKNAAYIILAVVLAALVLAYSTGNLGSTYSCTPGETKQVQIGALDYDKYRATGQTGWLKKECKDDGSMAAYGWEFTECGVEWTGMTGATWSSYCQEGDIIDVNEARTKAIIYNLYSCVGTEDEMPTISFENFKSEYELNEWTHSGTWGFQPSIKFSFSNVREYCGYTFRYEVDSPSGKTYSDVYTDCIYTPPFTMWNPSKIDNGRWDEAGTWYITATVTKGTDSRTDSITVNVKGAATTSTTSTTTTSYSSSTTSISSTSSTTSTTSTARECTENDVRYYPCPGGTQVTWCTCVGGEWACIFPPESQCPSTTVPTTTTTAWTTSTTYTTTTTPQFICGDGVCDYAAGENAQTCKWDCEPDEEEEEEIPGIYAVLIGVGIVVIVGLVVVWKVFGGKK